MFSKYIGSEEKLMGLTETALCVVKFTENFCDVYTTCVYFFTWGNWTQPVLYTALFPQTLQRFSGNPVKKDEKITTKLVVLSVTLLKIVNLTLLFIDLSPVVDEKLHVKRLSKLTVYQKKPLYELQV